MQTLTHKRLACLRAINAITDPADILLECSNCRNPLVADVDDADLALICPSCRQETIVPKPQRVPNMKRILDLIADTI